MKRLLFLLLISSLFISICWAGIDFDVVDDSISCGTADVFTENSAITISAWIYPESGGEGGFGGVVSRSATFLGPMLNTRDNGTTLLRRLQFRVDGTTDLLVATNDNAITYNTWQHVLVTWDGSTTATNVHIYVNGSEVTYATQTNGATLVNNSGQTFIIGNEVGGADTFDGQIDELAVWSAVLTAGEIALLANSRIKNIPLQIQPSNLKYYFPIDDQETGTSADADTVRDLSGQGNNGTGADGANNTGLLWTAETILSYPSPIIGN